MSVLEGQFAGDRPVRNGDLRAGLVPDDDVALEDDARAEGDVARDVQRVQLGNVRSIAWFVCRKGEEER